MVKQDKTVYMTERGIQKAQDEVERLLSVDRPELLRYLQDARDGGDAGDNTEYIFLTQELDSIDRRIRDLKYKLEHAQLIEEAGEKETVTLGSTVVIQENGAAPETYTIVGSVEADPDQGCISNESPLGRALLDRGVGEEVVVTSPDGQMRFRIVAIA